MNPSKFIFWFTMVVCVIVFPSLLFSGNRRTVINTPMEDDLFLNQPSPRENLFITYRSVKPASITHHKISFKTVPVFDNKPDNQTPITLKYTHEYLISFSATVLIGRIHVYFEEKAAAAKNSEINAVLQIRQASVDDTAFQTIKSMTVDESRDLTFRFSGRYTKTAKIILENVNSESSPINLIQIEEIILNDSYRIMNIGNSICFGKFAEDSLGYRKVLYDRLVENGFDIDFVGDFGDPPYEGHFQGGRKIQDLYPASIGNGGQGRLDVTPAMNNYRPHMVVIHMGTNDLNSEAGVPISPYDDENGFAPTQTGQMGTAINYLLEWANGFRGTVLEKILVSMLIPMDQARDSLVLKFNFELNRLVKNFQNGTITGEPEPVFLCDPYTRFRENPQIWTGGPNDPMYDALHPNTFGHNIMGEVFFLKAHQVLRGPAKWFTDFTWEANVAGLDWGFASQGVAVADITGDGIDEIYVSRTSEDAPNQRETFYVSQPDSTFHEMAVEYQVQDAGQSRGVVFVDIDNDSDFDLFNANSSGRNRLYENRNNTNFEDVTAASGVENIDLLSTAVVAFDAENDGDLDLFSLTSRDVNEFYLNDGNGFFQRVDNGLNDVDEPTIPNMTAAPADFDDDGDTDLYVVKRYAPNKLFVNDGTGHFSDQAGSLGVDLNAKSNGAVWADIDNDGDLDLVISVSATETDPQPLLRIFRNQGNGPFEDITQTVAIPMDGYSALVGDFDNNGFQDILTTNETDWGALFLNQGEWVFVEQFNTGAEVLCGDIRGASLFDFDNDGDLDFYTARKDIFNVLRRNNLTSSNHYLKVKAFGPDNNLGGFGTKIWLFEDGHLGDPARMLGFREISSCTGHMSQYSPTQHFGLYENLFCDLLALFADGSLLVLRRLRADQTFIIQPHLNFNSTGPANLISMYGGNHQSQVVNQAVFEPIVVKVIDEDGKPVRNAYVDFEIMDGLCRLLTWEDAVETVWIEAESGGVGGEIHTIYDFSCSGGIGLIASKFCGDSGYDSLAVDIHSAGLYYFWLRVISVGERGNVTFNIDGGAVDTLGIETDTDWRWQRVANARNGTISRFLDTGTHDFVFYFNSTDILFDKLVATRDSSLVPIGSGFEADADLALTDRAGLAYRFVHMDTLAGMVAIEARLENQGDPISGSPVEFRLEAVSAGAAKIIKGAGDNQVGVVGQTLADSVTVHITDEYNNPVAGHLVTFAVATGGGMVLEDSVFSHENGDASTVWVLGPTEGENILLAESANNDAGLIGSPVQFTALGQVGQDIHYNFVSSGWHLVSIPVIPADKSVSNLFPTAIQGLAYTWDKTTSEYLAVTRMEPANGYWIALPAAGEELITGVPITTYTKNSDRGMNLVGSVSGGMEVDGVTSNPPNCVITPFFYWDALSSQYVTTTFVQETQACWLPVSAACELTVASANSPMLRKSGDRPTTVGKLLGDNLDFHLPPPPSLPRDFYRPQSETFTVFPNAPNPFNESTVIEYNLPETSHVRISIYNLRGDVVMRLHDEQTTAGIHRIRWSGLNHHNQSVPSGLYFCRIEAGGFIKIAKLLLVR